MEFLRTSTLEGGYLLLLLSGILFDSFFLPAFSQFITINPFIALIAMTTMFILSLVGIIQLIYQLHFQKLLQLNELVFVPLGSFLILNLENKFNYIAYLIIIQYSLLNVLAVAKIFFFSQRFHCQESWSFVRICPFVRIIKLNIMIIILPILDTNISMSIIGVTILIQLVLRNIRLNYESFYHELILTLGSFLLLLSYSIFYMHKTLNIPYYFLVQMMYLCLYVFFPCQQLIARLVQFKYTYILLNSQNKIGVLKIIHEVLISNHNKYFSKKFQSIVVKQYLSIINSFRSKSIILQQLLQKSPQYIIADNIKDYYIFMVILDLTFFKFASDQLFQFQHIYFYVSLAIKNQIQQINKQLVLIYRFMQANKNGYLIIKLSTSILHRFILNLVNNQNIYLSKQQTLIFDLKFQSIRNKLKLICKQEVNFIAQCLQKNNSLNQKNQYTSILIKKNKIKYQINKTFNQCFQIPNYYSQNQFAYVYFLYNALYNKAIHQTKKSIERFFVSINNFQQLNSNINSSTVIFSCGLGEMERGAIINGNINFRKNYKIKFKQFGYTNISSLIPLKCRGQHIKKIQQSIYFQTKSKHQSYECYIQCQSKIPSILKPVKIKTYLFYDVQTDLNYFCEITDLNNQKFTIVQKSKIIAKSSYCKLDKEITVEQLGQKLRLKKIINQEIIQKNTQLSSKISNDYDKPIISSFNFLQNKFIKIQQKIHEKKFHLKKLNFYLGQIFIILLSIMIVFVIINVKGQSYVHYSDQSLKLQKVFFQTQQSIQLQAGLALMVIRSASNGQIFNRSIQLQFRYLLLSTLKSKFNELNSLINTKNVYQPEIYKIFTTQNYILNIFYDDKIRVSKIKQSNFLKSFYFKILAANLSEIDPQEFQRIKKNINSFIVFGNINDPQKFPTQFSKQIRRILVNQIENIIRAKQIYIIISICLGLLFVYFYISAYKPKIESLAIIDSVNNDRLMKKCYELNLIIEQLKFIQENHLLQIKFTSSTILYQSQKKNIQISIQQFQNLPNKDYFQRYSHLNNQFTNLKKNQQKQSQFLISPNAKIIKLEKWNIIVFIIITFLLLFIGGQNINNKVYSIQSLLKYQQIFYQCSKIKTSMMSLMISCWNEFSQDKYFDTSQTQNYFNQSLKTLKSASLKKSLFALYTPEKTNSILFKNLCQISQSLKIQCQLYSLNKFNYNFMSLIAGGHQKGNSSNFNFSLYITHPLSVYYLLAIPAFQNVIQMGYIAVQQLHNSNSKLWLYLFIASYITLWILIIASISKLYIQAKIIRYQILTFDTPKILYSIEKFKPHLNQMANNCDD